MIKAVETESEIKLVEKLAKRTWNDHYLPIIGKKQIDFMLNKFQSYEAINKQIEEGRKYYLISDLGYFAIDLTSESCFLSKLYILKSKQGKGYGIKAFEFIKEICSRKNISKIELQVNKYNPSLEFYKKIGFSITKEIVVDIGEGFVMDDYWMEFKMKK